MNKRSAFTNKLYLKISGVLLLLLVLLGCGYLTITAYISERHYHEVNQRLCWGLADHLVKETRPIIDGALNSAATHDIMHSMMVINPIVEVYILDPYGKIIDYVVPFNTVKLKQVDLDPIKKFIDSKDKKYIVGDDPKNPEKQNIFSAAEIFDENKLAGYAYIILAGEEQATVASDLSGNYMLKAGTMLFSVTLLGAMAIGLIFIWLLTRNLTKIIDAVRRFKEGDIHSRISNPNKGDLVVLANTFNEMADKIEANIEQLKSVEVLRRELIANVSHDLRTPLSIMQGYIETLIIKREIISQNDQEKYLKIVLDSSKQLGNLVAQLFEYSKLESNQVKVQKEAFQMADLVYDIYHNYQILAKNKNIDLRIKNQNNLPLVFADLALVERAIQNLIDNALKFTPEGGNVELSLMESKEGVEVRITDNGPGIPENEQTFIFERYHQAINNQGKSKGAGLGLAIVKKIMEFHNTKIQVKSTPNEGAVFWFCLPIYQH